MIYVINFFQDFYLCNFNFGLSIVIQHKFKQNLNLIIEAQLNKYVTGKLSFKHDTQDRYGKSNADNLLKCLKIFKKEIGRLCMNF